ncbi:MAG TPA: RNA polymerase sigma factor, partial [Anaerolineales bacterium]|nr:RNA polymerase sigma factor [Anaerolineales bacterium]
MEAKPEFDSLVQAYSPEIFAYLWRIFQDKQRAEDCLQDTFLKAYTAYDRFNWPGYPRAWLYRIATNTAFS